MDGPTAAASPSARTAPGWFLGLLLLLCLAVLWTATPYLLQVRTRGSLTHCEANCKTLAIQLYRYAELHGGRYPARLDAVLGIDGLTTLPVCPSGGSYGYRLVHHGKDIEFLVFCGGDHSQAYSAFSGDPRGFPQFSSDQELVDHP